MAVAGLASRASETDRWDALAAELASFEPALYTGPDCMAMAEVLAKVSKAASAASTRFGARAAQLGAPRAQGHSDAADWLARTKGQSAGQARAELELVDELDDLPATKAALGAGDLSIDQAKEIVKTEHEAPGSEEDMLRLAQRAGMRELREAGLRRRQSRIEADELRAKQLEAQTMSHHTEPELGMIGIRGLLAPEHGIPFVNRLDAETARLHREARRAGATSTTWEQHRAQAFLNLVNGEDKAGRGRTDLVIVADLNALRRGEAHDDEPMHIVGGGRVPGSSVREVLEDDPFLKLVLHDGTQVQAVKHLGRKKLSAEVLTALQIGLPPLFNGPRCAAPGCGRTAHLEKDHIQAVVNGGTTSLGNSQWLCWYHHVAKTERDLGRAPPDGPAP